MHRLLPQCTLPQCTLYFNAADSGYPSRSVQLSRVSSSQFDWLHLSLQLPNMPNSNAVSEIVQAAVCTAPVEGGLSSRKVNRSNLFSSRCHCAFGTLPLHELLQFGAKGGCLTYTSTAFSFLPIPSSTNIPNSQQQRRHWHHDLPHHRKLRPSSLLHPNSQHTGAAKSVLSFEAEG